METLIYLLVAILVLIYLGVGCIIVLVIDNKESPELTISSKIGLVFGWIIIIFFYVFTSPEEIQK